MSTTSICTRCKAEIEPYGMFPKGYCLDCHAATTEMGTAEDLIRMWKGGF